MDFKETAIQISNEYQFDEHAWVAIAEEAMPADKSVEPCSNHLDEKFMDDLRSYAYLTDEFIIA